MSSDQADGPAGPLLDRLRARIRREGPLGVDEYMRVCLADPVHGYWQRPNAIGVAGDFVTAPEISQVFGELIGLWCAVVWRSMGSPAPVRLIELGPGRGTLMRDVLRAARAAPEFRQALDINLIEISRPLREMQQRALSSLATSSGMPSIVWHERLEDVAEGPAIVIANEFLDALPIRQLVFADTAWHERVVDIDEDDALRFALGSKAQGGAGTPRLPPKAGDILEPRPGEDALLADLAARTPPHVSLFLDYGPAEVAYGDTLQAVRRHVYVDPLAEPGRADLTAHVQFAGFAHKARALGLAADGPIAQAEFLNALGIAERASRLMAANPAKAGRIEAGVQRLLSPTGMGQLFKVVAVRSSGLPPPPPFG